ncbi:MAG: hypothetical protein PHP42_02570 [Bacteroidota bacterium]|nr:hypothetical protein [Bacteroidota bacterium]
MIHNYDTKKLFDAKERFHRAKAALSFEEKVKEIVALQKIDMEFRKQRKRLLLPFMRVWKIDEKTVDNG